MNDLVVVVPGILGSELWKDGRMLWGFPGGLSELFQFKSGLRRAIDDLKLGEDPPDQIDIDDGVEAPRLLSIPQVIAGLIKSDGYDVLRDYLLQNFQLYPTTEQVANYVEFPYDWRRCNQVSALKLEREVTHRLRRWRDATGNPNAKVIYICHSMGGLVTRHYLEVRGGWESCRALITLGTPYRGAVNALNSLVTGYQLAGVDLTEVLRTCTAAYQLLPTYQMIDLGEPEVARVVDVSLDGIDPQKAREARAFHTQIQEQIAKRPERRYLIFYIAGVDQITLQSALLEGTTLQALEEIPAEWATHLGTGDGTVPYVSAIPPELSDDPRGSYTVPALHAMLPSNEEILRHVGTLLNRLQDLTIGQIQSLVEVQAATLRPAIQLRAQDLYTGTMPVTITARVLRPSQNPRGLQAEVRSATSAIQFTVPMTTNKGDWIAAEIDLPDGLYYVRIAPTWHRPGDPPPVEDIFEVNRTLPLVSET